MNDLYSMISMASNKLRTNKNIISFYKINVRLIILKKKPHHSASILCSDLCHLINVMLFLEVFFFSFNINPIQWQWNPDIHFIHKSDQSQPLLCPYVRITFPQKSLILIMHPAHFLVCPLKYLHTSCMPHDTTWNPQKLKR